MQDIEHLGDIRTKLEEIHKWQQQCVDAVMTTHNQAACIKSQKAQIETLLREVKALRSDNETLKRNNRSLYDEAMRFNGGWTK